MSKQKYKENIVIRVISFTTSFMFRTYPVFISFEIAVNVVSGIIVGLMIYLRQDVFDSVAEAVLNQSQINVAFIHTAILGAVMLFNLLIGMLKAYLMNSGVAKPYTKLYEMLHKKISKIDPICFEDNDLHDKINKAQESVNSIGSVKMALVNIFAFYIPYFLVMGIYFYSVKPIFLAVLFVAIIPVFIAQIVKTENVVNFENEAAPIRRENDFYEKAIIGKEFFKETRFLCAVSYFLNKYIKSLEKLCNIEWRMRLKSNKFELKMNLSTIISRIVIIFMLLYYLLKGDISIGVFAATLASIETIFMQMYSLVVFDIGNISTLGGQAYNFIQFMDFSEREGLQNKADLQKGIVAENIYFSYPHAKEESIHNISISLKPGEIVSVVGENGAGKSTLVKLLLGIYKPDRGKVTLCGMDTTKVNMSSLFENTSAVFQNFMHYQMSLADNITISSPNGIDIKRLDMCIKQAGVDSKNKGKFPNENDTMLSREFGGVELSGGEWQRVAIARGIYRIHDIIVLDEPTAAIDPLEEGRIYEEFLKISKGKVAIIVTHRLGSTKMSDKIIFMDKGEIISTGNHTELMNTCEHYRALFNAQAVWYSD